MDTKILEEVGLTPNESKVYLSLIELGSSSATQIIQKTGLHRAVVYDLLERLIEKGLVGHAIKGRKKFFDRIGSTDETVVFYESPHRILKTLEELAPCMGNRPVLVARELTKIHETLYRGSIAQVTDSLKNGSMKGEFVIVVAPKSFMIT